MLPSRSDRLWPGLAGLALTVFGARLWLIGSYGSAMPFWDQWPGEGWLLLKPWQEGHLTWAAMVAPSLEHRIFWTRALTLGLFELNGGQWDAAVETVANAAIFTAVLVGATGLAARAFPGAGGRLGVLAGALVLGVLPFAWENTLLGFASQFYFLLGFSLLALRGLGTRPAGSAGWWVGTGAAVAACLSMGSGPLAALAAGGWVAGRAWREGRRPAAGERATLAVCAAVALTGIVFRTEVPGHLPLRAADAAAWGRAMGQDLAWPFPGGSPLGAVVLYLPLALLLGAWLRRPAAAGGARGGTLLVGAWVLLQVVAMAYARGAAGREAPASRYLDLLAAGVAANLLAAWLLAAGVRPVDPLTANGLRGAGRPLAFLGAAGWTLLLAAALTWQTVHDFRVQLPARRDTLRIQEGNVRALVIGGDPAAWRDKPPFSVPFPDGAILAGFLLDPTLRATLPAVIRPPLTLEPEGGSGGFLPDGLPPALSSAATPADGPAWGSGEPGRTGEFRARLQPAPRLPYLRWELAGDLGAPGADLDLRVVDATGARAQVVHPPHPAGASRWVVNYTPVPAGAARIVATDHDAGRGFAFRSPVEVGPMSRWTDWLLRRGIWVLGAGLVGLVWESIRRVPQKEASPAEL